MILKNVISYILDILTGIATQLSIDDIRFMYEKAAKMVEKKE